jgi:hypothetical protein
MNPAPAAKVAGESGMDESLRIITVMSPENVMVFVAAVVSAATRNVAM